MSHPFFFPPEMPFPEVDPKVSENAQPQVPLVFEKDKTERMPLRAYAAIQLRVPDSGIGWLDQMIRRSRQLDSKLSNAVRGFR